MGQPKLPESKCLCVFTSASQGDSGMGEKYKKENACAKLLQLKTLLKKIILLV